MRRTFLALPVLAVLAIATVSSISFALSNARIDGLRSGDRDVVEHALSLRQAARVSHPREWIETATLLLDQAPSDFETSLSLLESALAAGPDNPNAWALLAFLYVQRAGGLDTDALNALQISIDQCGYCEKSLLRWRFTFVLQHWQDAPEKIRAEVFSGADFLRWWFLDYAYLNEVRAEALARRIPFDEYRRNVNSPIRPSEVR